MNPVFVTGTDTNIGKTIFSAMLAGVFRADYWKPVQSGLEDGSDTDTVRHLTGLPDDHFHPESYRLYNPLSPHYAAERDGISINPDTITLPQTSRMLVIEGAGGLMVPLTRDFLLIDLIAKWQVPVILCARTSLGTINHTLLSIMALRQRHIPIKGIAFIGDDHPDNMRTIGDFSKVAILGRLPYLPVLNAEGLTTAWHRYFDHDTFFT